MPSTLPTLLLPDVPFTLDTLRIIAPYAFAVALVGLLESLMTAKLVDDITDTHSDKTQGWGRVWRTSSRSLRRHGRLRHDRQDDDQREDVGRPHPDLHLRRRCLPARARRRPRRGRRADSDGRARRGDDHGLGRDDGLAQHPSPHPSGRCRSAPRRSCSRP
ncbi:MAG: hypothetical protein R2713_15025 [Ilumatobacteraceae bacterium]